MSRRKMLAAASALLVMASVPMRLLANVRSVFAAESSDVVLQSLFGDAKITESDQIVLKMPDIAENGAVVPVTVSTDMTGVKRIVIVIDNNPTPLSSSFVMGPGALPEVSTRIKMGESSLVHAFVETQSGIYRASKEVKVTIGGCGG